MPHRRPVCGGCLCPVAECACAHLRPRSKEGAKRPRGRPPVEDKRKPRGGFNDAEWREVKRNAAEWESCRSCGGTVPPEGRGCGCDSPDLHPMTAAAWLRMRAGV